MAQKKDRDKLRIGAENSQKHVENGFSLLKREGVYFREHKPAKTLFHARNIQYLGDDVAVPV